MKKDMKRMLKEKIKKEESEDKRKRKEIEIQTPLFFLNRSKIFWNLNRKC